MYSSSSDSTRDVGPDDLVELKLHPHGQRRIEDPAGQHIVGKFVIYRRYENRPYASGEIELSNFPTGPVKIGPITYDKFHFIVAREMFDIAIVVVSHHGAGRALQIHNPVDAGIDMFQGNVPASLNTDCVVPAQELAEQVMDFSL